MDNISRFQKTTGVGQILDESFARCPEREAIVFGDWRITYRELQALIYRTAHCLRSLGIAPGDRVAIISRNCPEVMIAEIAILKLGGTVVKFNWRLAPEEMTYLLDLNEVRCAFFKPEREDWGDALRQHYAGRITFLSLTPEADGRSALYSLLAGMPDTPVETVVAPDAPAYHMHTSGTTGRPKCVVYSHARYLNQLESMLETLEFPDGQVYQYISQLFHSACTGAYLTLATGGKLIMIPNFTVSDYVESLVREKVRAIGVIPLILQGILDEMDRKNYDLSQLKVINYSTCPISPDLLRRALDRLNCRFYQSYGMTEMASTVTALLPEDHLILGGRYLTSVGRALLGAAVRIVRPDGSLCDAGRDLRARAGHDARLLSDAGKDRGRDPRRLVFHARRGLSRRGRLSLPARPQGFAHHLRRREYLPRGSHRRAAENARDRRSRRLRHARPEVGRAREGEHRLQARPVTDGRAGADILPRQHAVVPHAA